MAEEQPPAEPARGVGTSQLVLGAESTTADVPAARRGLTTSLRRLGWGVADQGMSSLSNFLLGIFVARSFGASDFGAFTLAFVTYSVVLNAARGLATDPFVVRFSGVADSRWRTAAAAATGTALATGAVAGLLCVLAGLLLPHPLGTGFVALGFGLPGLALQDSWRFAFFAAGRGSSAFVNDLAWTVLLVSTLALLKAGSMGSSTSCLLAFGGTATLAALLGAVQSRILPRPDRALGWLRTHHGLSFRYLLENLSLSGSSQLRAFVVAAVTSLAVVGYVRASEILMGPFLVLLMGISQVAVPEATRVVARDPARLRTFCFRLGAALALAAAGWGVVLMVVFPLGPGRALLHELWAPASHLIPAVTLTVVAASFVTAANAGLRALGAARRSLRSQLVTSALYLTLGSVGAVLGGALGTSLGVTAAQSIGMLVGWRQLRLALADHAQAEAADS